MPALLNAVIKDQNSLNEWLSEEAPAKLNLMLSVHGQRNDGFHELTSLVVACDFGDVLEARIHDAASDSLTVDGVEVPADDSNLVLKASRRFREATGSDLYFDFKLKKRIPVGAGLGGGSSDAVAAVKLMDRLAETNLGRERMLELAALLGSDCPFFVDAVPALMRGRGELIEALDELSSARLKGQRILLFRPPFGVETAWAYRQMALYPDLHYGMESEAQAEICRFSEGGEVRELLQNAFEPVVGAKFLAIPTLLEKFRAHGHACLMSGSGSCCFALVDNGRSASEMIEISRKCWGDGIFWVETSIR